MIKLRSKDPDHFLSWFYSLNLKKTNGFDIIEVKLVSTPAENQYNNKHNLEETSCKDFKDDGTKTEQEEHQNNEEWEIIDGVKNFDCNGETQMEIPVMLDAEVLEELNKNILEDNTKENTPEEAEE